MFQRAPVTQALGRNTRPVHLHGEAGAGLAAAALRKQTSIRRERRGSDFPPAFVAARGAAGSAARPGFPAAPARQCSARGGPVGAAR